MANAANRRKVEAASRQERAARAAELQAVSNVMATPPGRAFVHRLLTMTGAERELPFSPNAMTLARDAGTQSVGYWLLAEIRQACPEQELVMRREAALLAQRAEMQEDADNVSDE